MKGKKIVIAGGTGFIGQYLAERWVKENEVTVLTRRETGATWNVHYRIWNGATIGDWSKCLEGADLLVNLAGKSVNCRYTPENKKAIIESRVNATNALNEACARCESPPLLWINASSATIYRDARDRSQDEHNGEMHDDFSVQVCKAWEAAFYAKALPRTRKVALRIAITLGEGGVMVPYKRLARFGLGGAQGDGTQMFSWIHIEDLARLIEYIQEHQEMTGTYNACAPQPVTNGELMHTIRKAMGIPVGLPAPTWLLRMGAWLIGTETELLLKSRWVVPTRMLEAGYVFRYDDLGEAITNILKT